MLSCGVHASGPVRMGSAGASGTHLLASFILFLVFCIVSFVLISLIVIMSLRTVVDGRHSVWVARAAEWQAHCRDRSRWMCQRRAALVSQWPVLEHGGQAF